jgi:predicted RNase H-like HicB family nuclease
MTELTYTAVFVPAEEGGFFVYAREMPGAFSQGETIEEARDNLIDLKAVDPAANLVERVTVPL